MVRDGTWITSKILKTVKIKIYIFEHADYEYQSEKSIRQIFLPIKDFVIKYLILNISIIEEELCKWSEDGRSYRAQGEIPGSVIQIYSQEVWCRRQVIETESE